MKITIENKTFELKFGFKCFINLGRALGLETFNQVVGKFTQFENNEGDISFDQLELIEKLVIAAAESNPEYPYLDYSIKEVAIIDSLMVQPKLLSDIMAAFVNSFPKTEGKQQANLVVRKPLKKKV